MQGSDRGASTFGEYTLEAKIGRGATGTVFVARRSDASRVAVKVVDERLTAEPSLRERFLREADTMRRVADANCVAVLDVIADEAVWIVMELVDGATLRATLRVAGPLRVADACTVMTGALLGLERAHSVGVLHRDFKPDNVLVDRTGTSKLCDFGLAAPVDATDSDGTIVGTPAYMSPEQVRGEPLDARSDVYAAGVVLYELLTGAPPFRGSTPAVLRAQVEDPPSGVDALPARLREVVGAALAKDRAARPDSARALREALQEAADRDLGAGWLSVASVAGLVTGAVAAGAGTLTSASTAARRRRTIRRPALLAATGAVVIAAASTAAVVARSGGNSRAPHRAVAAHETTTDTSATTSVTARAPTTTAPLVDPCLVGHWTAQQASMFVVAIGSTSSSATGGAGAVRTIAANGAETYDLSRATPFVLPEQGGTFDITFRGTITGTLVAARGGQEREHITRNASTSSLTTTGTASRSGGFASPFISPTGATYRCSNGTLVEHSRDGNSVTWTSAP